MLTDLVASYMAQGFASDDIAQQCYIELGKQESLAAMVVSRVAIQRVREAALGFNLLAVGSTWRPEVEAALPYWSRDWIAWCDKQLGEFERALDHASESNANGIHWAAVCMERIRAAFATNAKAPMVEKSSACYVATSVYGDQNAPQVVALRNWRDSTLSRSAPGRVFISTYYTVSPALVRAVGNKRWFTVPVRMVLDRLVHAIEQPMTGPAKKPDTTKT